ncbi:MAG: pantetheine-phosphate adenylyltransferase [Patescibacteria group bacterium]
MQNATFHHIFVAGTFDGLHAGHRTLLTEAFRVGERVTIGLTSDAFVRRFKSHIPSTPSERLRAGKFQTNPKHQILNTIKSYKVRLDQLTLWLRKQSYFDRAIIIPISDPFEPAASMIDLDALIVTKENRKTGERINDLRRGWTLSPLVLIEVPMVPAEDGKAISSTRLRSGEIDPDGRLIMPESMRSALGKPLGTVLKGAVITASIARSFQHTVITVGDMATKTVLDVGVVPRLAIIDGKVGRKPFHEVLDLFQPQKVSPFKAKFVKSGPGFISREAIEAVQSIMDVKERSVGSLASDTGNQTIKMHHVIIIDGEEDLLVLPVIEHAPLGSVLYYGQPGEGLVEVKITKSIKEQVLALLTRFLS